MAVGLRESIVGDTQSSVEEKFQARREVSSSGGSNSVEY